MKTRAKPAAPARSPLLAYQQAWVADRADVALWEKSRRIGASWCDASDSVLTASQAEGMDALYIGYSEDMTREYLEDCASWARAFQLAAGDLHEFLYDDEKTSIKAFRIDFASGHKVLGLSSRPRSIRGKQGKVTIDEAAFHDDLPGLIKAAMAMLIWGGRVRIISTHDGVENPFNELLQEARAGHLPYSVHRTTFAQALDAGLYERVQLMLGERLEQKSRAEWEAAIRAQYGEAAAEELDCVPAHSGGAFLPLALIEARMSPDTPLVRGKWKGEFSLEPEYARNAEIEEWCARELKPHLDSLPPDARCSVGGDCGRVADLTVFALLCEEANLVQRCVLHVELSNCPFKQQEQILVYLLDYVRNERRLKAGALDAAGIGAALAEAAAQRYGALVIEQVKPSEQFYIEQMPKFKAAFEDATLAGIPRDREIRDDLRAIRVIGGVPKLPREKTQRAGAEKLTRHGDAAIALFLAHYAAKRDVVPIEFQSLGRPRASLQLADFHAG